MPTEDELYESLKDAGPEERPELERQLFAQVQKHARAVVWIHLGECRREAVEDLEQEIAAAALRFQDFREESLYSTWVHSIAKRKAWEEIRRRTRGRRVFDENAEFDEEDEEFGEEPPDHTVALTLEHLGEGLSDEEKALYEAMLEGKDQNEIAAQLGIGPEAADSRRRRLREKLQRKFRSADG